MDIFFCFGVDASCVFLQSTLRWQFHHPGGIIRLLQIDSPLQQSLCGRGTMGNEREASTCRMWSLWLTRQTRLCDRISGRGENKSILGVRVLQVGIQMSSSWGLNVLDCDNTQVFLCILMKAAHAQSSLYLQQWLIWSVLAQPADLLALFTKDTASVGPVW